MILAETSAGLLLPNNPRGIYSANNFAVPQGLILYLPLGVDCTDTPTTYDSSLNKTNGTLAKIGTGSIPLFIDAPTGQGVYLTRTNVTNGGYVSFPNTNLPIGDNSRTICGWYYIPDNADYKVPFEYGVFPNGHRFEWVINPSPPSLTGATAGASTAFVADNGWANDNVAIPLNRWVHLSLVVPDKIGVSSADILFYLNAKSGTTTTSGVTTILTALGTTNQSHFIGADNPTGNTPQGVYGPMGVSDFRVYNRGLSQGEITEIYQAGLAGQRFSLKGQNELSILQPSTTQIYMVDQAAAHFTRRIQPIAY